MAPGTVGGVLRRCGLALAAGLALALSFEPWAWWPLLPPALAGFAVSTRGARARTGWVPGLVFGAAFYLTHIEWMRAVGTDAWIALSLAEAAFYAAFGSAAAVLHRLPAWPVWLAAAWVAMETVRNEWPLSGMPWGRLAYAVADTPADQALAYAGMSGVSFLLALLGFLLAAIVTSRARRRWYAAGSAAAVAVVSVLPQLWPYRLPQEGTATVAAVQGGVPDPANEILRNFRQVTANHVEATVELAGQVSTGERPRPDFVLWPENSTAVDPFRDQQTNTRIRRAVAAIGVPVVVGAMVDAGPEHVRNQGIVWDPAAGPGDRYTKWHPVPYGEYIPFRRYFEGTFGRLDVVPRDMIAGDRRTPLRVGSLRVADAICFDVAYDDGIHAQLRAGAQLLAVQTSNATFIFTDQIEQQFAITRLRAIETGRYVVVAATNGISGVIAPDGSVVARAETRTQAVLLEQVGLRTGLTPGVWLGPWPARVLAAVALAGLLVRPARRLGPPVARRLRAYRRAT